MTLNGKRIFVVVGLGYGDEGKGTIVDYLTHRFGASLIVRFNGGPQAAHHVVLPDGTWHCFAQFGSGTFVPEVQTLLSRLMIVDPESLMREAQTLRGKGVDFAEQCKVFAVCNPAQAGRALAADLRLNMALPCRISVFTEDGRVDGQLEKGHVAIRLEEPHHHSGCGRCHRTAGKQHFRPELGRQGAESLPGEAISDAEGRCDLPSRIR